MDVFEAIESRKSIRAFTDQPVEKELLDKLLQISQRSPSGTNTQPWYVYLCTGDVKQAITDDVLKMAAEGKSKKYGIMFARRLARCASGAPPGGRLGSLRFARYRKGDREGSARQGARNFKFFDAPVGLFVTVDSYVTRGSWADAGMYIQTIMLAARGSVTRAASRVDPLQNPFSNISAFPTTKNS